MKLEDIAPANRAVIQEQKKPLQFNSEDRAATKSAFDRRQAAQRAGNNEAKKASGQEIGIIGSERYMARERPNAERIYKDSTGNGNGTFDAVYKEGDQFIVVEAKGLGGRRRTRNAGTKQNPNHLQQGSKPYLDDVIEKMKLGTAEQRAVAEQLEAALLSGKVTYMEVATKKDGAKKWFTATFFQL